MLLTGADSDLCSQPEPEGVLVLTQKLLDQQEESDLRSESQNRQLGSLPGRICCYAVPK